MCGNNWDEIDYSAVPGRAMMKYRRAFDRHDTERFEKFINLALEGKENIHSKTLYPYDIVEKILYGNEDSKVLKHSGEIFRIMELVMKTCLLWQMFQALCMDDQWQPRLDLQFILQKEIRRLP